MCSGQTVDSMVYVPACVCYSRSYAVLRALLHLHTYLFICLSFWPVDPMAWALPCVDQQKVGYGCHMHPQGTHTAFSLLLLP